MKDFDNVCLWLEQYELLRSFVCILQILTMTIQELRQDHVLQSTHENESSLNAQHQQHHMSTIKRFTCGCIYLLLIMSPILCIKMMHPFFLKNSRLSNTFYVPLHESRILDNISWSAHETHFSHGGRKLKQVAPGIGYYSEIGPLGNMYSTPMQLVILYVRNKLKYFLK